MGETLQTVIATFNRSLRIESRADRPTGDPGAALLREILERSAAARCFCAVLLREIPERSGIVGWMTARLQDPLAAGRRHA